LHAVFSCELFAVQQPLNIITITILKLFIFNFIEFR
jgi:hypothetical protein